jgi:hypothetical protein
MSNAVDSANLILKLYELRREETMRKARDFMLGFDPGSFEDVQAALMGPQSSCIRMVTSYWEMACSFVTSGAIDAKMFDEANGEHILVLSKIQPFLSQLREMFGNPKYLKSLEDVCLSAPGGQERVTATRERIRKMLAMRRGA